MTKRMSVPADLRRRVEEAAADMGVPPAWVLRACIEVALRTDDASLNDLCTEVERVMGTYRVVRMPRYRGSEET